MSTKFHVNPEGNVSRCNAEKGNCPFGEDSHSDSIRGAERIYAERYINDPNNENIYAGVKKFQNLAKTNSEAVKNFEVQRVLKDSLERVPEYEDNHKKISRVLETIPVSHKKFNELNNRRLELEKTITDLTGKTFEVNQKVKEKLLKPVERKYNRLLDTFTNTKDRFELADAAEALHAESQKRFEIDPSKYNEETALFWKAIANRRRGSIVGEDTYYFKQGEDLYTKTNNLERESKEARSKYTESLSITKDIESKIGKTENKLKAASSGFLNGLRRNRLESQLKGLNNQLGTQKAENKKLFDDWQSKRDAYYDELAAIEKGGIAETKHMAHEDEVSDALYKLGPEHHDSYDKDYTYHERYLARARLGEERFYEIGRTRFGGKDFSDYL